MTVSIKKIKKQKNKQTNQKLRGSSGEKLFYVRTLKSGINRVGGWVYVTPERNFSCQKKVVKDRGWLCKFGWWGVPVLFYVNFTGK